MPSYWIYIPHFNAHKPFLLLKSIPSNQYKSMKVFQHGNMIQPIKCYPTKPNCTKQNVNLGVFF